MIISYKIGDEYCLLDSKETDIVISFDDKEIKETKKLNSKINTIFFGENKNYKLFNNHLFYIKNKRKRDEK